VSISGSDNQDKVVIRVGELVSELTYENKSGKIVQ
jgi:hypothetical protein